MLRTKVLAMSLYGIEATYASGAAINGLRMAMANAIAPQSQLRALHLAFEYGSIGEDLDPLVQIFARRGTMMRRMMCKHPALMPKIGMIMRHYTERGYVGTHQGLGQLCYAKASPPPGCAGRLAWKPEFAAFGPVGLWLHARSPLQRGYIVSQPYRQKGRRN